VPTRARALLSLSISLFGATLGPSCLSWSELQSGSCGDAFVGREEACDDGNRTSGDGCSDACRTEPPYCGDGRKDPDEDCDDANALDGDDCVEGCRLAQCGDRRLHELQEECDDGNRDQGDGCSEACRLEPLPAGPRCGDGQLDDDEGEVCDDGNVSDGDACSNACSWTTCGDGVVREGVEECDDGSPAKTRDGCSGCMKCGADAGSYFRGNGHCYTVHTETLSEPQAREACQTEGGDLWTTTSEAEAKDVASELQLGGRYWLGLLTSEGESMWVSGEKLRYTNFASGEPTQPDEGCVAFEIAEGSNAWLSQTCSSKLPFVCERAPAFIFPGNHHAFRLRTGALGVNQARESCLADGGYLAVLESDDERSFVAKSIAMSAWLDANDDLVEGEFTWSSGEPVAASAFAEGQPDDSGQTQGCLFLNAGARLADGACSDTRAYVCEFE
jgi:cysteine-rich repeat protein